MTSNINNNFTDMETMTKQGKEEINKPATKRITGSEAVILSLIEEGVDVIFGYPGGAIMPVYDALYSYQEKIRHILVRHEQGAAHAAQGYARASGKVGVALVTSGPGATNLITGIADAMIDSTPIVCLSGQVGAPLLGTDAFQETDVIGISMPITKWNVQVTKAEDIPEAISKAFYIARSGRPGPVLVDITKDAQFAQFDFTYKKCERIRSYVPIPKVDNKKIEEAATIINSAKKPFALIGQGVILGGAEAELKAFLEKTGIPAAWTILGNSALPSDHPLNMGMLGMHGNYGPNIKSNECDVLIALGMRFDDRVTGDVKRYAKQAKIIHLEIDPSEIDKNIKTTVAVIGDVKDSLPLLTKMVKSNKHPEWIAEFRKCMDHEHDVIIKKDLFPEKEGLTMGEVIRRINEKTKGEAIIVTDVGQHQMIASRYCKLNKSRSFITSGGLGTMGFGVPASIGAKISSPDKQVVTIVGDGGLQMTIQEFGTIFQSEIAVKIVLLNNNFLGMVRQWQELFFDRRYSSTPLISPDFIALAKAYSITGQKVTARADLDTAIETMLNHKGPYLLEVKVEKEDNVFPMVPAGSSVSDIRLE
jgi:acetolactate synthase I/II/III large subunit